MKSEERVVGKPNTFLVPFLSRLVKNYFFWIFLFLFFGPFIFNNFLHEGHPLTFWDYFTSCYQFIFDFLPLPIYIYNPYESAFSYMQFTISILGINQILALILALLDFPYNRSRTGYFVLSLFLLTLLPALFIIAFIVI